MALMILLTIYITKKHTKTKSVLLVMSIIMIIFEVYKQLSFSYDGVKWEYLWYAFPYQFCSTPMYIAFLAGIIKNEKITQK